MNRRHLLGAAALAPALIPPAAGQNFKGAPRNIIFMVADGMSPTVLPLAEEFSQVVRQRGIAWNELLRDPQVPRGFFDMASLTSIVTDSSSASSSWSTGSRIVNAQVNVLPDGTKLTPIATLARDKGKRVGLVTTTTITHATPAGFAAVSPRRDDEEGIALQYRGLVDVLLGGGNRFFAPDKRKDKQDAYALFAKDGYKVCRAKADLDPSAPKILGVFNEGHLPYTIDHLNNGKLKETVPTLAEMSRTALAILERSPKGFLLQIEGGRVDHAAHDNDAAAQMWDKLAFDDAVRVALEFARRRRDTLVILCSDHGNSAPALRGMGREYTQSNQSFAQLAQAKASFESLEKSLTGQAASAVRDLIRDRMGLTISTEDAASVAASFNKSKRINVNAQLDKPRGVLGAVLANHHGVAYVGDSHTADYVVASAWGPGATAFQGLIRNTDVFTKMAGFWGIRHRNPTMDPAQAAKFAASVPRPERPDWA